MSKKGRRERERPLPAKDDRKKEGNQVCRFLLFVSGAATIQHRNLIHTQESKQPGQAESPVWRQAAACAPSLLIWRPSFPSFSTKVSQAECMAVPQKKTKGEDTHDHCDQ